MSSSRIIVFAIISNRSLRLSEHQAWEKSRAAEAAPRVWPWMPRAWHLSWDAELARHLWDVLISTGGAQGGTGVSDPHQLAVCLGQVGPEAQGLWSCMFYYLKAHLAGDRCTELISLAGGPLQVSWHLLWAPTVPSTGSNPENQPIEDVCHFTIFRMFWWGEI